MMVNEDITLSPNKELDIWLICIPLCSEVKHVLGGDTPYLVQKTSMFNPAVWRTFLYSQLPVHHWTCVPQRTSGELAAVNRSVA